MQLLVTVLATIVSMYNKAFREFQLTHFGLFIFMLIVAVVCEIFILLTKFGRRSPASYILLSLFTIAESYLVSYICAIYGEQESGRELVLTAALMTLGVVLAATSYAIYTKEDFTMVKGILAVAIFGILQLLFFVFLWPMGTYAYNVYCALGAIIFGVYLVIDTQLIVGGKRVSLKIDEHVAAAMMLYVDIIQIFLYILRALGQKND